MAFKKPPFCPGNPEDYVLVKTKEGIFWRRKRGTVKPARLNTGFEKAVEATRVVAPAAKRIIDSLRAYLNGISTGRLNIRIGNALRSSLKEMNRLELSYLKGIEFQAQHPLDELLMTPYNVFIQSKIIRVELPIEKYTVKPKNRLVTHYYFEVVLLHGDAGKEKGLQTLYTISPLYAINNELKTVCVLEVDLPEQNDWCLLLKLSSLEGNEMAAHTKHYRMKVVSGKNG